MEIYLSKNVDVNSEGSRDWIEEHVVMLGHVNGGLHFLTMNYFAGNPRLSVIVNPVLSTGPDVSGLGQARSSGCARGSTSGCLRHSNIWLVDSKKSLFFNGMH